MDDVQKASDELKKLIDKLDDETLQSIFIDHSKAVKYVKNNNQDLSNDQTESLAHEMQIIAQMVMSERADK